ncbi:MAG: hypothetical protein LUD15_10020 [Bacteroides sp.]|nr:hypothetical protein [Bacteroides sp.]
MSTSTLNTIGELEKAIKDYKQNLQNLKTGSEDYYKVLLALADAQSKLNTTTLHATASIQDLGGLLGDLAKTGDDVVAGLKSVNGIIGMLTGDTSKLSKAIAGLETGISMMKEFQTIANGVKAATTAFKMLNAAMNANPYLAAAAAILVLVTVIVYLGNEMAITTSGVKELEKEHETYLGTLETQWEEQELNIRKLKAVGAAQTEVIDAEREFTKQSIIETEKRIENINNEIKNLQARTSWYNFGNKKRLKELKRQQKELQQIVEDGNKRLL